MMRGRSIDDEEYCAWPMLHNGARGIRRSQQIGYTCIYSSDIARIISLLTRSNDKN